MGVHYELIVIILCAGCHHFSDGTYTVFPQFIYAKLGTEVMAKLENHSNYQMQCMVTTPVNVTHIFTISEIDEPQVISNKKVTYWGGSSNTNDCGVRIRNISLYDMGIWNLTSINEEGDIMTGTFNIHNSEMTIEDQASTAKVGAPFLLDMTISNGNYCEIMRPGGKPFYQVFNGRCNTTLEQVTNKDFGLWSSSVGIKGQVEEVVIKHILTEDEWNLSTGMIPSNSSNKNAINLHCNLQHSNMDVIGCRFIRAGDKVGFFLQPGISNGNYGYYGNGLKSKECGLTIDHPGELDYGQWQCILIVDQDGVISTIESLVSFNGPDKLLVHETRQTSLIVMRESDNPIACQVDNPLLYCSIISPKGEWFVGDQHNFSLGVCTLQVVNFTEEHAGEWTCNMGLVGSKELQYSVQVKVVDSPLSALEANVFGIIGEPAVLNCKVITPTPSLSYCRFTRPDGIGFSMNKTTGVLQGQYEYYGEGLAAGDCGLKIKHLSLNDKGLWRCTGFSEFYEGEISDFITMKVTGSTNVFPSSLIVSEGEDVILKLKGSYQGQKNCTLTMPNNTVVDLSSPSIYLVSYWGNGLQDGDCGVKISSQALKTESKDYKMWTLTSLSSKGIITNGSGWIALTNKPRSRTETKMQVTLGMKVDLNCSKEDSDYCIMIPPGQNVKNFKPGSCRITIDAVTSNYLGNWTCIFGMIGSTQEVIEIINLSVKESGLSVGVASTYLNDISTNLYCNTNEALSFCRFVSPNETVFVLSNGLVTGRYSFWGNGLQMGDCGISITDPQPEDFGLWKCFVGIKTNDKIQNSGGYVILSKNEEISPWMSHYGDVFAVNGSALTIICMAETSLTYCWFKHPNGTQLASHPDRNGTGYYYYGQGLESGECGITVLVSQMTDSGKWNCHMGAESTSGEELTLVVNVTITENLLMTNSTSFEIPNNGTVIIGCQSIPIGTRLEYCRFVRPDDTPLNPDHETGKVVLDRYWYYGSGLDRGQCGMRIETVQEVDYGEWTCAARLQGDIKEEHQIINIQRESNINIALIVGLAVGALVIAVGLVIMFVKLKKSRHSNADEVRLSTIRESRQSNASSSNDSEVIYEEAQL